MCVYGSIYVPLCGSSTTPNPRELHACIHSLQYIQFTCCFYNYIISYVIRMYFVRAHVNRSLARRALELRDDLLTEHLATLRRVRRLVLEGSLVRTERGGGLSTLTHLLLCSG